MRRRWPYYIAGLIVFVVILVTAALMYLRSSAGSERILGFAKEYLAANQGTKLEYASGSLDPFTGLHFRDLKIHRDHDGVLADVEIRAVDVDYDLSIWHRALDIERVHVDHPTIKVRMQAIAGTRPTPTPAPAPSAGKTDFDELLLHPPAVVRLKSFKLDGLALDFESSATPGSNARVEMSDVTADATMALERGSFTLKSSFHSAGRIESASETAVGKSSAGFGFDAGGAIDFDLHRDGAKWQYKLKPMKLAAVVRDLGFFSSQSKTGDSMRVGIMRQQADVDAEADGESEHVLALGRDAVRSLAAKIKLGIGALVLDQRKGDVNRRSLVMNQDLDVTAKLADAIEVETDYRAMRINLAGASLKPADFRWRSKATISRDLTKVKTDGRATFADEELMTSELTVSRDVEAHAMALAGKVALSASPRLADLLTPAASLKKTGAVRADLGFDGRVEKMGETGGGDVKMHFTAAVPAVRWPALSGPLGLDVSGDLDWQGAAGKLGLKDVLNVRNDDYGSWRVSSELSLQAPSADGSRALLSEGRTELAAVASPPGAKPPKLPIVVEQPIVLTHKADMTKGRNVVEGGLEAPRLRMKGVGLFKDTHATFTARSKDLAGARDAEVSAEFKQSGVDLDGPLAKSAPPITGLSARLKASLSGGTEFRLDELLAELNGTMLAFKAKAAGNVQSRNLRAETSLTVKIPDSLPPIAGFDLRGRMDVPATLTVFHGRDISLVGELAAKDLSIKGPAVSASGFSGRLPFSEKLKWDGEHVAFTHLIRQNPFERVDFERVRPLLDGAEPLRIEKLGWEEKTYGPFVGFFSLQQNMLFIHQFDLDLGSGRVYGEMFVDAHPASLQFGALSRMTGVNLSEVLPAKFLAKTPAGDKNLSGRSGFVLDLNKGTMDGRVDITELGGSQLIALINVLDPKYEDEKMNKVRTLLQVGYPTAVALSFADGYLDMNVGLSVLGLRQNHSLRGIPVSNLLSKATADIVNKTQKGLLK